MSAAGTEQAGGGGRRRRQAGGGGWGNREAPRRCGLAAHQAVGRQRLLQLGQRLAVLHSDCVRLRRAKSYLLGPRVVLQ